MPSRYLAMVSWNACKLLLLLMIVVRLQRAFQHIGQGCTAILCLRPLLLECACRHLHICVAGGGYTTLRKALLLSLDCINTCAMTQAKHRSADCCARYTTVCVLCLQGNFNTLDKAGQLVEVKQISAQGLIAFLWLHQCMRHEAGTAKVHRQLCKHTHNNLCSVLAGHLQHLG